MQLLHMLLQSASKLSRQIKSERKEQTEAAETCWCAQFNSSLLAYTITIPLSLDKELLRVISSL